MALPSPQTRRQFFWARARTLAFRTVATALVAWGIVAAAVVLAIQFDLFDPSADTNRAGPAMPMKSDWRGVSIKPGTWGSVISPDSVLRSALALPDVTRLATNDSLFSEPQSSVEFVWRPSDLSAAWLVELRSPTCSCPYDQAQRWNILRAQLHPATGSLLGLRLYTDMSDSEYVRERFAHAL
jgi:hypothetical protein